MTKTGQIVKTYGVQHQVTVSPSLFHVRSIKKKQVAYSVLMDYQIFAPQTSWEQFSPSLVYAFENPRMETHSNVVSNQNGSQPKCFSTLQ